MLRSTPILLFLATVLVSTEALVLATNKDVWTFESLGNVSVITLGSHFYAVAKNNSHIIISTNSSYEVCDLEFDVPHTGSIYAAGIDRKILLLFRQNYTSIQMLQLDPFLCLYIPLPSLELSIESSSEPQLFIQNDTLDIFLNGTDCLPCRLDVEGNRLETSGQLTQANNPLFKSFILKELAQNTQIRRYAFVGNFYNGTSVLKTLTPGFNTTKEIYLKYRSVEALGANSASNQTWIAITYTGLGNPYERILALYSGDLELLFETRVKPASGYQIEDTLLAIDSSANTYVYKAQSLNSYDSHEIYVEKYQPSGQLGVKTFIYTTSTDERHWELLQRNQSICIINQFYMAKLTTTYMKC